MIYKLDYTMIQDNRLVTLSKTFKKFKVMTQWIKDNKRKAIVSAKRVVDIRGGH